MQFQIFDQQVAIQLPKIHETSRVKAFPFIASIRIRILQFNIEIASKWRLARLSENSRTRTRAMGHALSTAIITPINGDAPPPRRANADDGRETRVIRFSVRCKDLDAKRNGT